MSHAPAEALSRRHHAVRQAFAVQSLDALVVTALSNVLYLTNFTGSAAILVLTADRLHFITDFRYLAATEAARDTPFACPGLELTLVESSYDATLASVLENMPSARVGFEAANLTVARHNWLTATLARGTAMPTLVPTERIVEHARLRKDEYELKTLRAAAELMSAVVPAVFTDVRRGLAEREVAFAIDARMRQAGFERAAFDTIVAAGPNGALPHAHPTGRTLTEGDLVVLDFGGVYDSYCVDLTRTVSVGAAGSRAREVYSAVRMAHDRAIEAVRPGESRFAIDRAARAELERHGLAEAFGHSTGHGLGIEVHEEPRIAKRRSEADVEPDEVLPGMVFTIEPGVYLPGWGGVRIEDDVVVTEGGVEVLTSATTELIEL
jgi:Xaa-Pro aminopeptidase